MIEQIKKTVSTHNGSTVYYIEDVEKGIPYASIIVYPNGDYAKLVYGSFSFGRSSHDAILKVVKPTGNDVTSSKWQEHLNRPAKR